MKNISRKTSSCWPRTPRPSRPAQRLFVNYCTGCHGSDAGGGPGFPNLRDEDWLYGGDPKTIETTILNGRQGAMPAWGAVLGPDGVAERGGIRSLPQRAQRE